MVLIPRFFVHQGYVRSLLVGGYMCVFDVFEYQCTICCSLAYDCRLRGENCMA